VGVIRLPKSAHPAESETPEFAGKLAPGDDYEHRRRRAVGKNSKGGEGLAVSERVAADSTT